MKDRPNYFLSEENISHDSEVFDYIRELHGYMWEIVDYFKLRDSFYLNKCWDKVIEKIRNEEAAQ